MNVIYFILYLFFKYKVKKLCFIIMQWFNYRPNKVICLCAAAINIGIY
jgi:hypothetical protein